MSINDSGLPYVLEVLNPRDPGTTITKPFESPILAVHMNGDHIVVIVERGVYVYESSNMNSPRYISIATAGLVSRCCFLRVGNLMHCWSGLGSLADADHHMLALYNAVDGSVAIFSLAAQVCICISYPRNIRFNSNPLIIRI